MHDNYVWGGAVAGLVLIALLGVWLAFKSKAIPPALEPYIGEAPARWSVYVVWFVYIYSTINTLARVVNIIPGLAQDGPTVLSFGYGMITNTLLTFISALVPLVQTVALLIAGYLLYRHLKAGSP